MTRKPRRIAAPLGLLAIAALLTIPASPASAAVVTEIFEVPTVQGATLQVSVSRNTANDPQPVILTYSPYNVIGGSSNDSWVGKGYARAIADVLGTYGSNGCWDYGGRDEQRSGVDMVKFLASRPWSNGKVGMIGTSYDGTTANMVAATGIPELKAIVPIASISRWYGYAFYDGVRYFGNSRTPTDEGFDTPLAFDYGFALTMRTNDPDPAGLLMEKIRRCQRGGQVHTKEGYSRTPDYDRFWRDRDYRKDASKFRAATLIVHGWQDYNVKQDEGLSLYEAIPVDDPDTEEVVEGVPFKKLVMSQGTHGGVPGTFSGLVDRFFARALKGVNNGVENEPVVQTLGRTNAGAEGTYRAESAWPPPGTASVPLYLGRKFDTVPGVPSIGPAGTTGEEGILEAAPVTTQYSGGGWSHTTTGHETEETTLRDPLNREVARPNGQIVRGHGYYSLYHESKPLAQDVRIAGRAVLDAWVDPATPSQHLTPILVEVLPSGTLNLVERGFLNLDYRNGLAKAQPATGWQHARATFLPQDYTFKTGSRIGLLLQGSNTVWAVPGSPGLISYAMGKVASVTDVGTNLVLPIVNPPADPKALFQAS